MGGAAKVVTAPVKAVGKVVGAVAKPVAKVVGVSKEKPKVVAAPPKPTIQGRDAAAERRAARRRARSGTGGLLSKATIIGTDGSIGGLPVLGETGLGIRKSDLGYPPEV
jgi:hypothetical protein